MLIKVFLIIQLALLERYESFIVAAMRVTSCNSMHFFLVPRVAVPTLGESIKVARVDGKVRDSDLSCRDEIGTSSNHD